MRVVLDTNTLLSAIGWAGPPSLILTALIEGRHTLVISPPLLSELTRALTYPRLRHVSTLPWIPTGLAWLHQPEHIVIPRERIGVVTADPSDNMVLEAALAGRADAVVTGDRHLLRLRVFRGIPILTARRFAAEHL